MNESNKCCDCLDKLNDLYSSVNPATPVVVTLNKIYGVEGVFGNINFDGTLIYFKNLDNTITFTLTGIMDLSTNDKLIANGGSVPCSFFPKGFDFLTIDVPGLSYQFRTAAFTQSINQFNPLQTDIVYTDVVRGIGTANNADIYVNSVNEIGTVIYNGIQDSYVTSTSVYPFTAKSPFIINDYIRVDFKKDFTTPTPNNSFGCTGLVTINISGTT